MTIRWRQVIAGYAGAARRIEAREDDMKQRAAGNDQPFRMVFEVMRPLRTNDEASDSPAPMGFQVQDGQ